MLQGSVAQVAGGSQKSDISSMKNRPSKSILGLAHAFNEKSNNQMTRDKSAKESQAMLDKR